MSVDGRLRSGLRAEAEGQDLAVGAALNAVIVGARHRRSRRRRTVITAGLAIASTVGAVAALSNDPAPARLPSPCTSCAGEQAMPDAALLEGSWQAGPMSTDVVVAGLEAHQLGQWATAFLNDSGVPKVSRIAYRLTFSDGHLTLETAVDGAAGSAQDRQTYVVSGSRITLVPLDRKCTTKFGWKVAGGQLTLNFQSDSCPDYHGVPDEVFQRALYTSVPFSRTTS